MDNLPREVYRMQDNPLAGSFETLIMLVRGPTLRDAACIWITKYDGYTPPERFIIREKSMFGRG